MAVSLILGGARSGKSAYAENLAGQHGQPVAYIATAMVRDSAIERRVALHRETRPATWETVESPLQLAKTLQECAAENKMLLVDCLTMWITNLLCSENSDLLKAEVDELLAVLPSLSGDIIFVSNEVGMGIIPLGEMTRDYVDIAGKLHQDIAKLADHAVLVVAGLPMILK